jgi:carbon-monoxide dehydrogenase large subunit
MSASPSASADPAPASARFGSGRAVKRVEDDALLTGQGRFADDVAASGEAVVVFLRSPHAHAAIASIDTRAAAAMPGVVAIVTGADLERDGVKPLPRSADFKRAGGKPSASPPQRALATDVVRHVGEPVAAIVATSLDAARDAAEAIDVRYDPRPAVAAVDDAIAPGAAQVWPEATGNVACVARHGDAKAVAAAFARAKHVVGLDLVNQRVIPAPVEPRTTLAAYDAATGRTTIRTSCQTPTGFRDDLANEVLGVDPATIRVLVGDVGGGFGMKTTLYGEDVVVAWCAKRFGRPMRWRAERLEEFLSASHGRDVNTRIELAFDGDGKILALKLRSRANLGAYATPAGAVIQLLIGPWVTTSVYDIPAIDLEIAGVLTHTTPTGPYRGAGRPEAIYFLERVLDAAARATGIDPVELRRRNFIAPSKLPYRNPMAKTYDTGRFEQVMEGGLAAADWTGFPARAAASEAQGRLRGRGLATFLEWTGADVFTERVTVTVSGEDIEIFSATQGMGQGLLTSYAQLAVDVFGVPIERIRVVQGDTDRGTGFGSAGSRSLFVGGSAVHVAAVETVDAARKLAGEALEAAPTDIDYREGVFRIAGTDRSIGIFELAERQPGRRFVLDSTSSVDDATWPNGCHACEVEIDPDTGAVEIASYASMNDVGRVVNPMIVVGQLEGGAAQGAGQALCEAMVFDRASGQPLSATFMDYALPRASMFRRFDMRMDESIPCRNNLLGVKGVGELGTIGATPTVVNAVIDALARAGVPAATLDTLQMPLTSERVWRALQAAR